MNLTYDEKAKLHYEKNLERMRTYVKNNKDKMCENSKKQYQKIKQDPEKYKLHLEKRRLQYKNREAKRQEAKRQEVVDDEIDFGNVEIIKLT